MSYMVGRGIVVGAFILLAIHVAHAQRMESALTPFTSVGNLILIPVRINDAEPLTFVFDTGEDTSLIDAGVARRIGLKINDPHDLAVPGGTVQVGSINDASVAVGPARLKKLVLQAAPISPLGAVIGVPISGIIGHDFIKEFSVKIDYAGHGLVFWDAKRFVYQGNGSVIPVAIENGEVFFPIQLHTARGAAVTGKFKLDTGSIDTLGMNNNFVRDNHILAAEQAKLPRLGAALGGDTRGFEFRLASVQVGPTLFNRPVVGYTADSKGFENRNDAGTVGAAFLSRFTVYLDYRRRRIILEPVSTGPQVVPPDAVGAMLRAEGKDLSRTVIRDVAPNSPAANAGVRAGDEIVTVDGRNNPTLAAIWERFHREGVVQLTVKRADGMHDIKVLAQPLLP